MSGDKCVVDSCDKSWDEEWIVGRVNSKNCSGFVQSVAKNLGIELPAGSADDIIAGIIKSSGWRKLASGAEASKKAGAGHFVIAGLKAGDHNPPRNSGHVVVVVGGTLYREKYPRCWSGSTGGAQSKGLKTTGEVWNRKDRDNVVYYAFNIHTSNINACKP